MVSRLERMCENYKPSVTLKLLKLIHLENPIRSELDLILVSSTSSMKTHPLWKPLSIGNALANFADPLSLTKNNCISSTRVCTHSVVTLACVDFL